MSKAKHVRKDAAEMQSDEARLAFSDLLSRVGFNGERIVITRYGKRVAALVGIADLERLDSLPAA